jgi:hypothetical protein
MTPEGSAAQRLTADDHIAEAQRLVAGINSAGLLTEKERALRADVIARATMHATLALALQGQDAGICDHGNTGVCMSCVIQHDLLRPSR